MIESEQALIQQDDVDADYTPDIWKYITMKLLSLCLLFVSVAASRFSGILFLASVALVTIDTFVTRSSGFNLTGLRWTYDPDENGKRKLSFYSKPDPYIPSPLNVRIFWGTLFVSLIVWGTMLLIFLFSSGFFQNLICICNLTFIILNVILFNKCRNIQIEQGYDAARTILLGDEFSSDKLEDDNESNEEEEKKEEKDIKNTDNEIELKLPEVQQEQIEKE